MQRALVGCLVVWSAGCGSTSASGANTDASVLDATSSDASSDANVADARDTSDATASDSGVGCSISSSAHLMDFMKDISSAMRTGAPVGSNALVVPSPSARDAFAAQVVRILGGDEAAACALPASYRLLRLSDPAFVVRVIAEVDGNGHPAPSLYWGTFVAPATTPTPSRDLVIEAPHPIFDTDTEIQATAVFLASGAKMLLVAGAHRCADTAPSVCSGTTDACGTTAPYRISDAAHTEDLAFFALHALVSNAFTGTFLQLHGNGAACPDALVSDCSGAWSDAGAAAGLASALASRGVGVGKCGAGFPTSGCNLCGTDNVEARMTAGAAAACTANGTTYGRFVHVEQQRALRESPDAGVVGYQPLVDAVNAAFPVL